MPITAKQVADLRDKTGIPMMTCKKALEASNGDEAGAIEWLRKNNIAVANKKASNVVGVPATGMALGNGAGVVLLAGCQTDFVSSNEIFKLMLKDIADAALNGKAATIDQLKGLKVKGQPFDEFLAAQVAKLGENIQIASVTRLEGPVVAGYNHGTIATLVAGKGSAEKLRQIAMHVASATPAPVALDRSAVPADVLAKEREIVAAQPDVQAKPEAIRPKIIEGKLTKFYKEQVLLEQEMLLDADKGVSVEQYAKTHGLGITGFVRIQ